MKWLPLAAQFLLLASCQWLEVSSDAAFRCFSWCKAKCLQNTGAANSNCSDVCSKYHDVGLCPTKECWDSCLDLANSTANIAKPDSPRGLLLFENGSSIRLSWLTVEGATFIHVIKKNLQTAKLTMLAELPGSATSYEYRKSDACDPLEFRLHTVSPAGISTPSDPVATSTLTSGKFANSSANLLELVSLENTTDGAIATIRYQLPLGFSASFVKQVRTSLSSFKCMVGGVLPTAEKIFGEAKLTIHFPSRFVDNNCVFVFVILSVDSVCNDTLTYHDIPPGAATSAAGGNDRLFINLDCAHFTDSSNCKDSPRQQDCNPQCQPDSLKLQVSPVPGNCLSASLQWSTSPPDNIGPTPMQQCPVDYFQLQFGTAEKMDLGFLGGSLPKKLKVLGNVTIQDPNTGQYMVSFPQNNYTAAARYFFFSLCAIPQLVSQAKLQGIHWDTLATRLLPSPLQNCTAGNEAVISPTAIAVVQQTSDQDSSTLRTVAIAVPVAIAVVGALTLLLLAIVFIRRRKQQTVAISSSKDAPSSNVPDESKATVVSYTTAK